MKQDPIRSTKRTVNKARRQAGSSVNELHRRMKATAEEMEDQGRAAFDKAAEWAADTYENGRQTFDHARETVSRNLYAAGGGLQRVAAENPLTVAAAGLAAGFILGALVMRYGFSTEPYGYDDEDEDA